MKKWIGRMAVLLAFVLTLSGSTLAAFGKIPSATKEFYVNDYAGVFSDTWKEELCKAGEQLYEDTTAQLVVLTVDTTDGEDISDYAVETGRKWGIGSKKKNNGVLIVLSVSDRKVWVSVGYGLEGKLIQRPDDFWMNMQFHPIKTISLKKVPWSFIMHC